MSIKNQITSGLLIIFFLSLIILSTLTFYLKQVGQSSTQILEENYRAVKASEAIMASLHKIDRILIKISFGEGYDHDKLTEVLDKERKVCWSYLRVMEKNISDIGEKHTFEKIESLYKNFEQNLDNFNSGKDNREMYFGALQWQSDVLFQRCLGLSSEKHFAIMQKDKTTQNLYYQSKINSFLIAIVIMTIIGFVINNLPQRIVQPLLDFHERAKSFTRQETLRVCNLNLSHELVGLANTFGLIYRRLKDTEQKFWMMAEGLHDIVFFSKTDHKICYATPSITGVLGYPPDKVLERPIFSLAHPKDVAKMKRLSTRSKLQNSKRTIEVRFRDYKGKYIWMELKCAFQHNEQNQLVYIQFTAFDITQRKTEENRAKRALKREKALNLQLKQSKEEIDHFLHIASHSLRGPLASIMGLTQILKKTPGPSSKILEMVDQCLARLDKSIHGVVLYEKNNKLAVKADYIDLKVLIEEVIQGIAGTDNKTPINIQYTISDRLIFFSDKERLKIVFETLVANAIAFSKPNHPNPWLVIEVKEYDGLFQISFRDNGIGIKAGQLEKIFQIFYRSTSNSSGAGLGLYIARQALQKIKGRIKVRSIYGKGSEFILSLKSLLPTGLNE